MKIAAIAKTVVALFIGIAGYFPVFSQVNNQPWKSVDEPVQAMEQVRKQIHAPIFPARNFLITAYGAVGDGKTLNTAAFNKAIVACNKAGGGHVVVPFGVFLTGAIHLKSNVDLHLADSARVLFSTDPKDYPIVFTRWEGMELMNYSALIYAYGQENIAITGHGILDGNASYQTWWSWNAGRPSKQVKARDLLHEMNHKEVAARKRIFGDSSYLRPNFIQPYNCKNILISGVRIIGSPMWNVNPVLCENVTVDDVTIIAHGPNTDGVDPESCKNVLIRNCYFDTGDDCIAIKSGRDEDGRKIARPAENHIIENCEMKDGHGGVVIGSEISGGARNIFAINCKMDSPNLERVLRFKTSSSRGGIIENVFMKDVKVGTYADAAVTFNMFYEQPGKFMPVIRNIWVENLDVEKGGNYGLYVKAYPESPVENLKMIHCNIRGVKTPVQIDYVKNLQFEDVMINGRLVQSPASLGSNAQKRPASFVKGADISWLPQMEATGFKFYSDSGLLQDCFEILRDHGINAIRLRTWVHPSADKASGHCSMEETVAMAVRAQKWGMGVMIDFHYSDSWADPGKQRKPAAWEGHLTDQLQDDIYQYTTEVMLALAKAGVHPEWVQVGNEITPGMLLPEGSTRNWTALAGFVNKGYEAIKKVSPLSKVILHIDEGNNNAKSRWWFDSALAYQAKYDVIGLSYYPYWLKGRPAYTLSINDLGNNLNDLAKRYKKEIMIVETGGEAGDAENVYQMLIAIRQKVKAVPENKGLGVMYWEPEGAAAWSRYALSAWRNDGRPTKAMDAFRD